MPRCRAAVSSRSGVESARVWLVEPESESLPYPQQAPVKIFKDIDLLLCDPEAPVLVFVSFADLPGEEDRQVGIDR